MLLLPAQEPHTENQGIILQILFSIGPNWAGMTKQSGGEGVSTSACSHSQTDNKKEKKKKRQRQQKKHWTINSIQIGLSLGKINVGFSHLLWTYVHIITIEYPASQLVGAVPLATQRSRVSSCLLTQVLELYRLTALFPYLPRRGLGSKCTVRKLPSSFRCISFQKMDERFSRSPWIERHLMRKKENFQLEIDGHRKDTRSAGLNLFHPRNHLANNYCKPIHSDMPK